MRLRLRRGGGTLLPLAGALACWVAYAAHSTLVESRRIPVKLYRGKEFREVWTSQRTVAGLLREQGIALRPQDVVVPPPSAALHAGVEIDLGLVEARVVEKREVLPYREVVDYTDDLNVGEIVIFEEGKRGLRESKIEVFTLNGVEAFEKVLQFRMLERPRNRRVLEGTGFKRKLYSLKEPARVQRSLVMRATAYYPGPEDTGPYADGLTATNQKAGFGVAAVDPKFLPLQTRLYVEGYGYAVASDVGGAIKGNRIDLCFDTYEEAVRFGRREVRVHVLR